MAGHRTRGTARGLAVAVAAAAVLSGCSGDGGSSGNPTHAASQAASAAASLASQASAALASATAEAARRIDGIKGAVNAKGDVRLGTTATDANGRKAVPVTVTNSTSQARTYTVQVDFHDAGANLLDTVVVTVDNVPAGGSKNATAFSNRVLSGNVTADVARAVRY
ncbi:hypothetical protein [Streptomyces sp. TP-A0356]|uniref:hypothetical protein n=1 Tax=Streptomyces sp. TP-A0356 TaxID=1359208 RepID=UPI0006E13040|nr:hypothetical protein [Streptomyces sp. TP-A0356]